MRNAFLALCAILLASSLYAADRAGFQLTVLVNDDLRPEYNARGNVYVEAVRGSNYSLRITNPTPYRVAVALSVDGLNTIDAKHSDPWTASKWVLDPYESTVISGWQVSDSAARRFFFTGERDSYGAALGQTQNLGVIEAVFFRERPRRQAVVAPSEKSQRAEASTVTAQAPVAAAPSDDYAATGMGERTGHEVTSVNIDLDRQPVASIRIRYEFREQLVKLGVLRSTTPLDRRERARGFEQYCPQP
ncbi:MAG TPA: hypothetical protein VF980_06615 [Thermoanaerobaculia bacterium]